MLLSGRGRALLCEELALRARLDLDAGRLALAAIELERAYAAALGELPTEGRADLRERIEELEALSEGTERAAHAATRVGDDVEAIDEQMVRHGLERLEATLRARTASGFIQSS